MLLRLPFVRRVLRGAAGAGWGRSRGFRLLNLYAPYEASLLGRAAEAGEARGRLPGSWAPARTGSREAGRAAGAAAAGLVAGGRSKRSARAFTLVAADGDERGAVAAAAAGPEAERGVDLGGGRAPLV